MLSQPKTNFLKGRHIPKPALTPPADLPPGFGNCGVFGVAMLCGVTHERALGAILSARREENPRRKKFGRGSWNGGTTVQQRHRAIQILGFEYHSSHPDCSVAVLARENLDTARMIRIRRHVLILHRNFLYDQTYPNGVVYTQHPDHNKTATHATWLPEQPKPAHLSTNFLKRKKQ